MAIIRLLVVDAQPIYRAGVAAVLRHEPGIEVVGATGPSSDGGADWLLSLVDACAPDVVLLDSSCDDPGLAAWSRVRERHPLARMLVSDPVDVVSAVRAGAAGLVARSSSPEELSSAIRAAAAGESPVASAYAGELLREVGSPSTPGDTAPLTVRELEVLRLMAQGLTNRAIAERLFISPNTVKNHVHAVREKLGAPSRTKAVADAVSRGWVTVE